MNQLDTSQASLWTNIDLLSKCHLSLELPTCSFQSEICLSSAQFSGDDLIVPDEGLALRRRPFNEIFALQNPNRLYFLSHQRNFGLTLTPDEEKAQKQLGFLIKSFELERGATARDEKIESVVEPNLCPCCVNYANIRIQQMAHNPLTAILADAAQRSLSLIVSCDSPGGRFTTPVLLAHEVVIEQAVAGRKVAAEAGDAESEDLLIGRVRIHQKAVWFLNSYLK